MRKILSVYLAILIGLFIVLSIADKDSDYIVEKKIWKVYQEQLDIAKDPNVIPDKGFDRVIKGYESIIESHPQSRLVPDLRIHIGETYILRKDYDGARSIFYDIIKSYPENKEIAAEVLFKVGGTFEANGDWSQAVKVYQSIFRQYPLTSVGLSTPLYIANYYRNQNEFQATMGAYEFAIQHYSSIASAQENTKSGLTASRHLANCYLDQNRWTEAINTLGMILEKYATSDYLTVKDVDMVIKTINITSAYQLKDYDVAIALYANIIERNPTHPLNDYLNKVIDAFNQLKERGIQVSDRK